MTLDTITEGTLVRLEGEAVGAPAYATVLSRRGSHLRVRWHGHDMLAAVAAVLSTDAAGRPVAAVRRFEPWAPPARRQPPAAPGDVRGPVAGGDEPGSVAPQEFQADASAPSILTGDPVTIVPIACEGDAACSPSPPTAQGDLPPEAPAP